jgi:hypothetical protein
MENLLDERFQRVEAAVNKLVSSIVSLNPSVEDSKQLVAADEELFDGIGKRN